jgi:hypothetical protein
MFFAFIIYLGFSTCAISAFLDGSTPPAVNSLVKEAEYDDDFDAAYYTYGTTSQIYDDDDLPKDYFSYHDNVADYGYNNVNGEDYGESVEDYMDLLLSHTTEHDSSSSSSSAESVLTPSSPPRPEPLFLPTFLDSLYWFSAQVQEAISTDSFEQKEYLEQQQVKSYDTEDAAYNYDYNYDYTYDDGDVEYYGDNEAYNIDDYNYSDEEEQKSAAEADFEGEYSRIWFASWYGSSLLLGPFHAIMDMLVTEEYFNDDDADYTVQYVDDDDDIHDDNMSRYYYYATPPLTEEDRDHHDFYHFDNDDAVKMYPKIDTTSDIQQVKFQEGLGYHTRQNEQGEGREEDSGDVLDSMSLWWSWLASWSAAEKTTDWTFLEFIPLLDDDDALDSEENDDDDDLAFAKYLADDDGSEEEDYMTSTSSSSIYKDQERDTDIEEDDKEEKVFYFAGGARGHPTSLTTDSNDNKEQGAAGGASESSGVVGRGLVSWLASLNEVVRRDVEGYFNGGEDDEYEEYGYGYDEHHYDDEAEDYDAAYIAQMRLHREWLLTHHPAGPGDSSSSSFYTNDDDYHDDYISEAARDYPGTLDSDFDSDSDDEAQLRGHYIIEKTRTTTSSASSASRTITPAGDVFTRHPAFTEDPPLLVRTEVRKKGLVGERGGEKEEGREEERNHVKDVLLWLSSWNAMNDQPVVPHPIPVFGSRKRLTVSENKWSQSKARSIESPSSSSSSSESAVQGTGEAKEEAAEAAVPTIKYSQANSLVFLIIYLGWTCLLALMALTFFGLMLYVVVRTVRLLLGDNQGGGGGGDMMAVSASPRGDTDRDWDWDRGGWGRGRASAEGGKNIDGAVEGDGTLYTPLVPSEHEV